MVYKPLDLLFDHLLLRNEHVFKNFNQFCLKGGVRDSLSHLHDLDNRFLKQDSPTWSKGEAIKINRQELIAGNVGNISPLKSSRSKQHLIGLIGRRKMQGRDNRPISIILNF